MLIPLRSDFVYILLVCIDWENAVRILGATKLFTPTLLLGKFVGCLQQVILERFSKSMNCIPCLLRIIFVTQLGKIVCQTNETDSKRSTCLRGAFCSSNWIPLLVDQFFQSTDRKITEILKFFIRLDLAYVDCRQDAQSNLTSSIINMVDGISRQSDLLTQVRHIHLVLEGRV